MKLSSVSSIELLLNLFCVYCSAIFKMNLCARLRAYSHRAIAGLVWKGYISSSSISRAGIIPICWALGEMLDWAEGTFWFLASALLLLPFFFLFLLAHSHTRRPLPGIGPCPRMATVANQGQVSVPVLILCELSTLCNCNHREILWERDLNPYPSPCM